jgi:hypothetical protein
MGGCHREDSLDLPPRGKAYAPPIRETARCSISCRGAAGVKSYPMNEMVKRALIVLVVSLTVAVAVSAAFPNCKDTTACDVICTQPCALSLDAALADRYDRRITNIAWLAQMDQVAFLQAPDPPPKALYHLESGRINLSHWGGES